MVTHSDQLVPVGMLGAFVSPLVQTHQTGKVMGITSRGIFLLFDHRVFFLTAENHENPFMIHIPHLADLPRHVLLNQEVHLEEGYCVWAKNTMICALCPVLSPIPSDLIRATWITQSRGSDRYPVPPAESTKPSGFIDPYCGCPFESCGTTGT